MVILLPGSVSGQPLLWIAWLLSSSKPLLWTLIIKYILPQQIQQIMLPLTCLGTKSTSLLCTALDVAKDTVQYEQTVRPVRAMWAWFESTALFSVI